MHPRPPSDMAANCKTGLCLVSPSSTTTIQACGRVGQDLPCVALVVINAPAPQTGDHFCCWNVPGYAPESLTVVHSMQGHFIQTQLDTLERRQNAGSSGRPNLQSILQMAWSVYRIGLAKMVSSVLRSRRLFRKRRPSAPATMAVAAVHRTATSPVKPGPPAGRRPPRRFFLRGSRASVGRRAIPQPGSTEPGHCRQDTTPCLGARLAAAVGSLMSAGFQVLELSIVIRADDGGRRRAAELTLAVRRG